MSITPTATTTTVSAPLPRLAGGGLAGPVVHKCAYCHQLDTTAHGALWRVSPLAACSTLYYLHTACLAPYKVAHGLRSVEGRIPRSRRASASATRTLIDGRWRGRIAHYPGTVRFWYELRARALRRQEPPQSTPTPTPASPR